MIANELLSPRASMIDTIRQSIIPFHLTGSRFFGNETPESDWDFFVEDRPSLPGWLRLRNFIRQGFYYPGFSSEQGGCWSNRLPDEFIMDPTIKEVWRYNRYLQSKNAESIHVQIIKPDMMWLKLKSQEIIRSQNLMRLAPRNGGDYKALSRAIWISVMRTVQNYAYPQKIDFTKYYIGK